MNQLDRLKMIYGFMVLLVLSILALAFGLGKVESNTSYGLMPLVVALANMATHWATWAFSQKDKGDKE